MSAAGLLSDRTLVVVLLLVWASIAHAAQKPNDADCLTCHSDQTLTDGVMNGKPESLYVDQKLLQYSVHGALFSCLDCHKDVKSLAHQTRPKKVSCAQCHSDAQNAYTHSTHAQPSRPGNGPAAKCESCHGPAHAVLASEDPKSPVNHANIPATCGACHGQGFLMKSNGESAQPFYSYQASVHGRAVENGSMKAAVCTDCHGSHAIVPASQPQSTVCRVNVPATCGKCHVEVASAFARSIHGQAIARGNDLAPTCTDCHGIHSIQSHTNPNAPTSAQNLSRDTCAPCHAGARLSQEFGVPGGRITSYFDSYHGLAVEGGSLVAANCSSCHGVHDILPSSDPRSTVNLANLGTTCGKCHKGVTRKFIETKVHLGDGVRSADVGSVAVRWVRRIYVALILLVIGAMFLHNAILWRRKAIVRRQMVNPMMTRMTVNQRWQHLILLTSFIILVITGFALKFPDSWFAHLLGMGEKLRSITHRVAGVVLIGAGVYHIVYVAVAGEGRRLIRDLAPVPKDGFDVWASMRYHLGLSQDKPKFGRFNYAEKAEYWALVWGTALMGLTGVMMWANVWVGDLLARWWVDVATAIHFYEAILATLAIVVWHFYQVIFDPDVYPMNWAWWDGKMPVEKYRHEHELDEVALQEPSGKTEGPSSLEKAPAD